MSIFDGVPNVAQFNKKIQGRCTLELTDVLLRDSSKDPEKRMVIFKWVYVGPDEFFENDSVDEFFTYYKDMSDANLDSKTDRERNGAVTAFQNLCNRLMDIGFSEDEVNKGTSDPMEKVGILMEAVVSYNKQGYRQIGKGRVVTSRSLQKPSSAKPMEDLLD